MKYLKEYVSCKWDYWIGFDVIYDIDKGVVVMLVDIIESCFVFSFL